MGCFISDLSGASFSIANPINMNGAFSAVTLNGSTAVLSVPASPNVSGKILKLGVVAKISDDGIYNNGSGTSFGATLNVGTTFGGGTEFGGLSGVGIGSGVYAFEADVVYDSGLQTLSVFSGGSSLKVGSGNSNGQVGGPLNNNLIRVSGVSSQTGIQFIFGAYWNNSSNPASVVLSQFTLGLM